MKKSKYINKYDYIGYYTKQKDMWFYTNSEIQTGIDILLQKFNIQENEIDSEEFIENNFDAYEYYSEIKLQNKNIDNNNPLIIEGNIIDKLSKEKIKNIYKINKIVDFDDKNYEYKTMEDLAIETKNLLNLKDDIIIFQPVFIFDKLITKPDALIKEKDTITIVETKGTTSSKVHHLLDLLFQKNIIENQIYLSKYNKDYKLCLVSYEKLNKNELKLIITPYCNISKNSLNLSEKIKKDPFISDDQKNILKQKLKIGEWFQKDDWENPLPISITKILNNNWIDYFIRFENIENKQTKKSLEKFQINLSEIINQFSNVVEELWDHKNKMIDFDFPKEFIPSIKDNGFFKTNEYWPQLRNIYSKNGWDLYSFSGKIMNQNSSNISSYKKGDNLESYILGNENNKSKYIKYFLSSNNFHINESKSFNEFQKIKNKKIYFDFESINTAIRNVDNSFPFNQIVTQCSIIHWFPENKIDDIKCNNLIIDPINIDNNWFKKIIDSLYSKDNISYIVYNKTFEKSRMKEMANFINEKKYFYKVKKIIDNLFDLANFFNPTKDMIIIKELYGFFSIKKILPIVEKYHKNICHITKSKNYNNLEVNNGLLCQQKTTQRFFKMINDQEWKKTSIELQEYCENDVRAMIAIELFIKFLIENKKIK